MIQRTKQNIAIAVATLLSISISGCFPATRFRPSSTASTVQSDAFVASNQALAVRPRNLNSPFFRIVGESAPPATFPELELLAAELHSELAFRGGVRLEDSALVAQLPTETCGPSAASRTSIGQNETNRSEIADSQSRQEGKIKTMSAQQFSDADNLSTTVQLTTPWPTMQDQAFNPQNAPLPASTATASSNFEIGVIINDFTPYRPMQLAATFVVRDLTTGQEINRIQQVWRGITYEPKFGGTRKDINRDLRHPVTRQRLEHTALSDISPRHMIKRAATEIADSLYQSLVTPTEAVSGQYSSALQEFHQPR